MMQISSFKLGERDTIPSNSTLYESPKKLASKVQNASKPSQQHQVKKL